VLGWGGGGQEVNTQEYHHKLVDALNVLLKIAKRSVFLLK
jgi:hypothetical protein